MSGPVKSVPSTPLLTEAERNQILVAWNDTAVDYPTHLPLNQFIEDQVERTPDAVALIFESQELTYRQMNQRANQIAHWLRTQGVGPDVLVGVCAERSLEMVLALLGIVKAGGAYVPLDPEYPRERLSAMIQDAKPPIVLTQAHLQDRLPESGSRVVCLDRDWKLFHSQSVENPPVTVHGKNLAYAIYTSGSTGKPKGVPNVHEGIVNRLLWMQDAYHLTAADRVLQKTPYSFDVSVWEFFWPLMTGAALVIARPGGHKDPAYLIHLITEQKITTLHFVPSMLRIFLEASGVERCRSLRQVFASGEALTFDLQQRFLEKLSAELHNLYGPTEAAVDVTFWRCRPDSKQSIVPIGKPIANTQIYILDPSLQPVPIGAEGELHIGGIGLARGYLNQPGLTAEKFIPNPFSQEPGRRLYKTGDLARFLPDGNIEYIGRIDHQVKLRGFRIELGEIEAALTECGGVRQAVVTVREDTPGDKRLAAYLVAIAGKVVEVEKLKAHLREKLPEYMVPAKWVTLEAFPMTTSGKVDRGALPAPSAESKSEHAVAPRNELERKLAAAFQHVLGLEFVGVTDNFFDLGGHSLLAVQLMGQIAKIAGREIPLSALFNAPTVESMAQWLQAAQEPSPDPVAMCIQSGRGGLSLFAIVPPGEESLGYAMLSRHLGTNQTVYKIQAHAPIVGKRPYTEQEFQSLAREYADAMRSTQPDGPYCLVGLCDGAHIAERIIVELEAHGDEVALFAIIDTWVLQHSQRPWLWRLSYFQERMRAIGNRSLPEQFQLYKKATTNRVRKLLGKAPSRTEWQETYWPENYTPTRFRAPVVLFKRRKQPYYYVNDPQMGWGARTKSGVEIHEIEFDHLELLREPHVGTVGETLATCIERVRLRGTHPAPVEKDADAARRYLQIAARDKPRPG
jgi:amino acid adenylation domain-containing protein